MDCTKAIVLCHVGETVVRVLAQWCWCDDGLLEHALSFGQQPRTKLCVQTLRDPRPYSLCMVYIYHRCLRLGHWGCGFTDQTRSDLLIRAASWTSGNASHRSRYSAQMACSFHEGWLPYEDCLSFSCLAALGAAWDKIERKRRRGLKYVCGQCGFSLRRRHTPPTSSRRYEHHRRYCGAIRKETWWQTSVGNNKTIDVTSNGRLGVGGVA